MREHPAKYNFKFIPSFVEFLSGCKTILDPFGGTGRVKLLEQYGFSTTDVEIEPEWATCICGDSQKLPFKDNSFDGICTSPTYGNRMADSFVDKKPERHYKRNTYHHTLGRKPSFHNTGLYHFGKRYLNLHEMIYKECKRVLKPNGVFVLNTKNFIHSGVETDVTNAHLCILSGMGFVVKELRSVPTNGLKYGDNRTRVQHEQITKLCAISLIRGDGK